MNKVWIFLLGISIAALLFLSPELVLTGMIAAAHKAVKLTLELCAVYAVWMGIFGILEYTGIATLISKLISPLIDLIFGKNELDKQSKHYVSLNISANLLGMNGAATPMGIKAIESMYTGSPIANRSMVMLVVISCTSLQLLPTSILGMLTTAGSAHPASIILPSLLAGGISTIAGILLVKLVHYHPWKKGRKHGKCR